MAKRLKAMGSAKYQSDGDPRTSGPGFGVAVHPDTLAVPLGWRKPRTVFVNSMSDLFHARVPAEFIAEVFASMSMCSQHTFIVLTKRADRMCNIIGSGTFWIQVNAARLRRGVSCLPGGGPLVLPNVWLGVSAENQTQAERRIGPLLFTPAAVRLVSIEPMLDAVNVAKIVVPGAKVPGMTVDALRGEYVFPDGAAERPVGAKLDWVIVGGESGANARPMDLDWISGIIDQCHNAKVPVFVKQLGTAWARDRSYGGYPVAGADRHGRDPRCWPFPAIREFPAVTS
jgi:protein gp37